MVQYYVGQKIVLAYEGKNSDGVDGYIVTYKDGYVSWSPKQIFEESNIPIDMNIEGLPEWGMRLVAEVTILDNSRDKLLFALTNQTVPKSEVSILTQQLEIMDKLSSVLHTRVSNLYGRTVALKDLSAQSQELGLDK